MCQMAETLLVCSTYYRDPSATDICREAAPLSQLHQFLKLKFSQY